MAYSTTVNGHRIVTGTIRKGAYRPGRKHGHGSPDRMPTGYQILKDSHGSLNDLARVIVMLSRANKH